MSVGLYRHASLGETRKYILNNKHVLEVKVDLKQTEDWFQQYTNLKESLLRNQKIKFCLLPEEVYIDREDDYDEYLRGDPKRAIVFEHYIITLREELQTRIKSQDNFSKSELWFFLYAFVCGAVQMLQIREFTRSADELEINLDTIVLNQYGFVKLVGSFSVPLPGKRTSFRTSQASLSDLPQKIELITSNSVGRALASLIMLKEPDEFMDNKQKGFNTGKMLEELRAFEDKIGIIYNIIRLMLVSDPNERLMISEVKALLLPYQDQILSLEDFAIDRETSRASMIDLFVNQ